MSNNPYAPPGASSRDSLRKLCLRRLPCPSCESLTVSVGRAAMYYPLHKIRCTNCHNRIRIRLLPSAALRFNVLWFGTIAFGVVAILLLMATDPFVLFERFFLRYAPGFWSLLSESLGQYGQRICVGVCVLIAAILPILVMAFVAFRTTVRSVLTSSTLILVERNAIARR